MFNDHYGLTQAVLDGIKKMTRRIAKLSDSDVEMLKILGEDSFDEAYKTALINGGYSRYKSGEVIAIAQNYKDAGCDFYFHRGLAGWNNKMFVRADEMPHRIKITNIRAERLQNISDEDCLKEGLEYSYGGYYVNYSKETCSRTWLGDTPRKAFAALIDKVSGKGTWDSNPWVFVYEFERIQ